jgi:tetratricopeptide (TPR) repeat protein
MTRSQLTAATFAIVVALLAQTAGAAGDRFDHAVRADFFAGFRGDAERFARGMKRCEEVLAANPDHAEALVWHGAGLMFLAGEAAARQDVETARGRARQAREELDRAVLLAPDSLNVVIVRAVVLNAAAPRTSDPARREAMQQAAVAGFEKALALQTPYLDQLSEHARGELLGGLAEGWSRLGDTGKARAYLTRIATELPDTRYAARAKAWLEDGPQAGPMTCLTCHRQ